MPEPTPMTTEKIERAARKLAERRPAYATMLAFYADVFCAQEISKGDLDLEPIRLAPDTVAARQHQGLPLVDIAALRVDTASAARLVREICRLIAVHQTQIKDAAERLAIAFEQRDLDPKPLFRSLLSSDDGDLPAMADRIGIDRKALVFICYHGIQPSIESCATQLATHLDPDEVRRQSGCPVCGSAPGLALLAHEGRRVLCCSFCRHQWRAPRVFCALCENTRAGELHYLFAEDEKDLRVDVCDRCRQYLKSVDTRDLARPVFPPLEQVASLHLDMIAAQKGYKSGVDIGLES
ncbi:MAG: formate dehydrogenase accessory protein FdhE [Desulfobacterales bacterium]|nr:formate dehydrogenase accessory protein FdhE [Desulfobacterales bacterium]